VIHRSSAPSARSLSSVVAWPIRRAILRSVAREPVPAGSAQGDRSAGAAGGGRPDRLV